MTLTLSLIAVGALFAGGIYWYRFWKAHAIKFAKSGYTPPRTSVFGRAWFCLASRLLTFATVGSVKVLGKNNLPAKGRRVIFAANHQLPCDFAMVRRGSGRHFRMLTLASELKGLFGVISAFLGVISVVTGKNGEGAQAEAACVDAISDEGGSLGIFPQGALLPDNVLRKAEFRPGLVRMAKAASTRLNSLARLIGSVPLASPTPLNGSVPSASPTPLNGSVPSASPTPLINRLGKPSSSTVRSLHIPVSIVPMAILYRHDPVYADWTHRILSSTRSMFKGMRNPKHWDPLFKLDIEGLPGEEQAQVEQLREEKLNAYRKSRVTNYGGVVVIGQPIDADTLPEDPLEAIEVVRLAIAALLKDAEQR